jgi:hypothetical protein
MGRQIAMYFAWDRPAEIGAPLGVLENRFPALFEVRRLFWPQYERLADPERFDQGIEGFLEHLFLANFKLFTEQMLSLTGRPVRIGQRHTYLGRTSLDAAFLSGVDTLIIISFDTLRSSQQARFGEILALEEFLSDPDHTLFVCPHHDIGAVAEVPPEERRTHQQAEFHHHGDPAIPAQQRFGGFALSVMSGLGLPIRNRYGLRPAKNPDGSPAPFEMASLDRLGLLDGVATLNVHPHLPHLERLDASVKSLEVLVRQPIEPTVPVHPFVATGRTAFDAVLQARPDVVAGRLFVTDATLWSSTSGALESLQRLWHNAASLK